MLELWDGTRKNDKHLIIHMYLHPLGFPSASPLGWLPLKGTPFLMKLPLGLNLELWKCLSFSTFGVSCLRLHYPSWCAFLWWNLFSFLNPDFSPRPTFGKPSTFMMASNSEANQFSSSLRFTQVRNPITKWHTWSNSCICRISSMSSEYALT